MACMDIKLGMVCRMDRQGRVGCSRARWRVAARRRLTVALRRLGRIARAGCRSLAVGRNTPGVFLGAERAFTGGGWQIAGGEDGGEEETLVRPLSDHERLVEFMRRLSLAHTTKQARACAPCRTPYRLAHTVLRRLAAISTHHPFDQLVGTLSHSCEPVLSPV